MADKKISQLVDGGTPQATDEFVIDRGGTDNFKIDYASLEAASLAGAVILAPASSARNVIQSAPGVTPLTINTVAWMFGSGPPTTLTPDDPAAPALYVDVLAGGFYMWTLDDEPGWVIIGGSSNGVTPHAGAQEFFFSGKGYGVLFGANGGQSALTDSEAFNGTGNGIYWQLGASDGQQFAYITAGTTGQFTWTFAANGSASFPGALTLGTDLAVADGGTGASAASGARTNLGLVIGTDVASQATADAKVAKSLYDANTVLAADSDDTPAALTMGASTILARLAAGNIKAATPTEIATLLGLVIGVDVPQVIKKPSDTTRSSTNTPAADPDLLFALSASATEVWFFELFLRWVGANTTMDVLFNLSGPAGSALYWGGEGGGGNAGWAAVATGSTPNSLLPAMGSNQAFGSANGTFLHHLSGFITGGGTGGNVTYNWSQNTVDAGNLVLKAGSLMRLIKVVA